MENHAVALVILDTKLVTYDTHILVGVRRPESNAQHKNVLSVPTERIPEVLFEAIESKVSSGASWGDSNGRPGDSSVAYAVKSILCQKLGLADSLELGNTQFTSSPKSVALGVTQIISEGDEAIQWKMAQIAVHIPVGADNLPPETASYMYLDWIRVGDFLEKVDENGFVVGGETSYVVGGLCVKNTARWLREAIGD
jgi:hypothetical protein